MPTPANVPAEDAAMMREPGERLSPAFGVERGQDEPDIWSPAGAGDLAAAAEEDEAVRMAAEYLERRQADAGIRDILANADFQGPYWEEFAEGLIRYGTRSSAPGSGPD